MNESLFSQPRRAWLLGCLLILAAAIRVYASLNDLWLDEIMSFSCLENISAPLGVFTHIHHDNNHYLNSLWLYVCGSRGNWPGYRLPSIVAGVGSVLLAGLICRRRGAPAAFFAMALVAFSYVQIVYSSEARGYSHVVFFSFLSFYALENFVEKQSWKSALLYSVSSILGFAAHLIFLNFFCAAVLWSGLRFFKAGLGTTHALRTMLACHAAPAVFLILLYWVDIRHLIVGGGTESGLLAPFSQSLAWTLGDDSADPWIKWTTMALAAVLFFAAACILWREQRDALVFFAGVILVFPILLTIAHRSPVIYARYFMVGMAFSLVLLSSVLAALYQRALTGRILCMLLLVSYFLVNASQTLSLLRLGRGHCAQAVRFLIQNTKGPKVTVGCDSDLRALLLLRFFLPEKTGPDKVIYYKKDAWPDRGPEWLIFHKESFENPWPDSVRMMTERRDRNGALLYSADYAFVKSFPTAPLSGMHWFIYHNLAD